MKKAIYLLFIIPLASHGQLSLDSCLSQAERHYKFAEEKEAILRAGNSLSKNATSSRYPELSFDYSSTYQNEQLDFPGGLPGTKPTVPLDFHRANINFSQRIYDGSIAAHRKRIELMQAENEANALDIQIMALRSSVIRIFMTQLLLNDQASILRKQREMLQKQLERLTSAVNAGIVEVGDEKIMQAEILELEQRQTNLAHQQWSMAGQLSFVTGMNIDTSIHLQKPKAQLAGENFDEQPEVRLLYTQLRLLDEQKKLASSNRLPKVRLFGNVGYGNPGYNILDNTWQPMALIGIGVHWNIWDWNNTGRQKQVFSVRQDLLQFSIERKKTSFQMEALQQRMEVDRIQAIMNEDQNIVKLRHEVVSIKASKLAAGTITSTDYITEVNRTAIAEINQKIHELEYQQAVLNYNIITGNQ